MTVTHDAPLFTDDEARDLRHLLVGDMFGSADPYQGTEHLETVVYGWETKCWRCKLESYVWMDLGFVQPRISELAERADVIAKMTKLSGCAPVAKLGTVTTKAGGTYRGFTCPWCDGVHGKHFLTVELYRLLLDRSEKVTRVYAPEFL